MAVLPKEISRFNEISIKTTVKFFKEIERKSSHLYRTKKTPGSQSSPEKKEWSQGYHTTWLQIILQIDDNQNSMALAEKQTHWSVEQSWEPSNKTTGIWTSNFWQRSQKHTIKKCYVFLTCINFKYLWSQM